MDTSSSPDPTRDDYDEHVLDSAFKRRREEINDLGSNESGCADDSGKVKGTQRAKKPRMSREGSKLSCPYRKRNPLRFNVRDYGSCALNGFSDMALLKRHIKTTHQRQNLVEGAKKCPRCKLNFPDQAALDDHLTTRDICEIQDAKPDDPEDGISEKVDSMLKIRDRENGVPGWENLWELLFPKDKPADIPMPDLEPLIELDQVEAEFFAQENLEELRREFHRNTKDNNASLYFCFNYITTVLSRCRSKNGHTESPKRRQVEEDYLVRAAACMRFNKSSSSASDESEHDGSEHDGSELGGNIHTPTFLESDVAVSLFD